ncbi:SURF1 family cytochrome oxidase biogenesis protein, partial [Variovorax paradoxus]|uniref:SURF1 family cytochrome oxidase biogenesis protein n=1 Tax=Variovorax paradoxus TaxID=34073 RepID=UPI001ABC50C6
MAARLAGAGTVAAAALGLTIAAAQTTPVRSEAVRAETPKAAPTGTMAASAAAKPPTLTKPLWAELTAEQQQALQPLAPHWNTLNVGQKRKWLALSRNYASLPAEDQITLRSRMIEWAALSNQQRVQARLNFAEVKRVHAVPVAPPARADWPRVNAADDEYRHVRLSGTFLHEKETLVQASTNLGAGFWVLTPLQTARGVVMVNRGFVPPEARERAARTAPEPMGETQVTGLLRISEPRGGFLRSNDPA